MTIETIDAHLGKATVLAVVLRAHTRLEVESLRQASGLRDVKKFTANHVHQVWSQSSLSLVSVGGNDYLVETQIVWVETEIQLLGFILSDDYTLRLRGVTHILRLDDERTFRQVLQKEVARHIGGSGDGCSLHLYDDIRHVLARLGIHHMTIHIGIRALGYFLYNIIILNFGCMSRE